MGTNKKSKALKQWRALSHEEKVRKFEKDVVGKVTAWQVVRKLIVLDCSHEESKTPDEALSCILYSPSGCYKAYSVPYEASIVRLRADPAGDRELIADIIKR